MNILSEYYDISKDENNDYYILNGGKKIKSKTLSGPVMSMMKKFIYGINKFEKVKM